MDEKKKSNSDALPPLVPLSGRKSAHKLSFRDYLLGCVIERGSDPAETVAFVQDVADAACAAWGHTNMAAIAAAAAAIEAQAAAVAAGKPPGPVHHMPSPVCSRCGRDARQT